MEDIRTGYDELNAELELPVGHQDDWLSPAWMNCTSQITVPWYAGLQSWISFEEDKITAFDTVRGIRVRVPVELSQTDYVSLFTNYQTSQFQVPLDPRQLGRSILSLIPVAEDLQRVLDASWLDRGPEIGIFRVNTRQETSEFRDALGSGLGRPDRVHGQVHEVKPITVSGPRIVASPSVLTVAEGDRDGVTYNVRLSAEPDDMVSVEIGLGSNTDLPVSRNSISFDTNNWDDPQPVTVRALHDDDAVADAPASLVHTAYDSNRVQLDRKNVVVVIKEDDVPEVQLSGPRWLSSSTEVAPRTGSGGRLEVRVLTLDTTVIPSIAIDGPGMSRTRQAGSCSLQHRPPGYVAGVTRCWDTVFTPPVNDTGSIRTYTVTAESTDIADDLVTDVAVSPTPEPDQAPVAQPGATTTVAVATGLAPLGNNLQWVLRFDNAIQQWQSHSPAAPSAGTLTELVPGQVYWIGVNAGQTVELGGATRTLKAGLNQVVW